MVMKDDAIEEIITLKIHLIKMDNRKTERNLQEKKKGGREEGNKKKT